MVKRGIHRNSTNALKNFKLAQEQEKHNELILALNRLINRQPLVVPKNSKLNVSNLALEAGVSRGSIYTHVEIFEKIKAYKENPNASDYQIAKKANELKNAKEQLLNEQLKKLQQDKFMLAQENLRINLELKDALETSSLLRKKLAFPKVVDFHKNTT